MKTIVKTLSALALCITQTAAAQVSFGNVSGFNEGWMFNLSDRQGLHLMARA
ncbi:MAG: hypothetical protein NC095_06680 [Muribaculum sp.]|nr:hypothetical protein [Muribaculum sp.]